MCERWEGLGVTPRELAVGMVVMVPVGQLNAAANNAPCIIALATVRGRASDSDASVYVNPTDVYWLDVHMAPGVDLPQMYPAGQILGVPALGLTMTPAEVPA